MTSFFTIDSRHIDIGIQEARTKHLRAPDRNVLQRFARSVQEFRAYGGCSYEDAVPQALEKVGIVHEDECALYKTALSYVFHERRKEWNARHARQPAQGKPPARPKKRTVRKPPKQRQSLIGNGLLTRKEAFMHARGMRQAARERRDDQLPDP